MALKIEIPRFKDNFSKKQIRFFLLIFLGITVIVLGIVIFLGLQKQKAAKAEEQARQAYTEAEIARRQDTPAIHDFVFPEEFNLLSRSFEYLRPIGHDWTGAELEEYWLSLSDEEMAVLRQRNHDELMAELEEVQ